MENIYTQLKTKTKNNSQSISTKATLEINKHKKTTEDYLKAIGLTFGAKDFIYDMNNELVGVLKTSGDIYIFSKPQLKKLKELGLK